VPVPSRFGLQEPFESALELGVGEFAAGVAPAEGRKRVVSLGVFATVTFALGVFGQPDRDGHDTTKPHHERNPEELEPGREQAERDGHGEGCDDARDEWCNGAVRCWIERGSVGVFHICSKGREHGESATNMLGSLVAGLEQVFIYHHFVKWIDMRRVALLVVCVLGLALAGCSGPSDGTGDGPAVDVSPAEPPTITTERTLSDDPLTGGASEAQTPTARPDATFQGVEMPPGTDQRGIVNPQRLLEANTAVLESVDFVVRHNQSRYRSEDGTRSLRGVYNTTFRQGRAGRTLATFERTTTDDGTRETRVTQSYVTNGTIYTRDEESNVSFDVRLEDPGQSVERSISRSQLGLLTNTGSWNVTGTTTANGRVGFVFERHKNESETPSHGRVVVDKRGLIHSLQYTVTYPLGSGNQRYTVDYRIDTSADVSITPPSWLERARAAATNDTETARQTTEPN